MQKSDKEEAKSELDKVWLEELLTRKRKECHKAEAPAPETQVPKKQYFQTERHAAKVEPTT